MRHITIDFPLKLFSHAPGSVFALPGTSLHVHIYPVKVILEDLSLGTKHEIFIPLTGPVKDFTAELDLDEGIIKIYGHYKEGYALFIIEKRKEGIYLLQKKGPLSSFSQKVAFTSEMNRETLPQLYLGVDKKADIDKMRLRKDPKEYLPYLYRLSCFYFSRISPSLESHSLFKEWDQSVNKKSLLTCFDMIFLALFTKGLTPRLEDNEFQGITETFQGNPLDLWGSLHLRIRKLFIEVKNEDLFLLPSLPPSFAIGRMIQESFDQFSVSFLWKGGEIKRCVIHVKENVSLKLHAPHSKKFRYKGKTFSLGEKISLEKGLHFFDRFTK